MLRQIEKATRQKVEPMHMPTAEAVNETRKQRFAQQITETIESEDLSFFREIIEDYENEHDTTAEDIAAALAVIAQQGRPFFLDESEDIANKSRPFSDEDSDRGGRKAKRAHNDEGMVNYKLNVGRSSRVTAGAIVGALANEGGIKGSQIGSIDIRQHFTIVGLPEDLPATSSTVCVTPRLLASSSTSARTTVPRVAAVAAASVAAVVRAATVATVRVAAILAVAITVARAATAVTVTVAATSVATATSSVVTSVASAMTATSVVATSAAVITAAMVATVATVMAAATSAAATSAAVITVAMEATAVTVRAAVTLAAAASATKISAKPGFAVRGAC